MGVWLFAVLLVACFVVPGGALTVVCFLVVFAPEIMLVLFIVELFKHLRDIH